MGDSILVTSGLDGAFTPSASDWDAFVATHPGDVLTQTTLWASTKQNGSGHRLVGVRRGGTLVGGAMLLLRRIGPWLVANAPRGPILDREHGDLAPTLVEAILSEVRSRRPTALIVQPVDLTRALSAALESRGFSASPINVSTPATVEIDLAPDAEALLAAMRSSRRRNIRRAAGLGVEVRRGGPGDIELFHDLHTRTGQRQGFEPMSLEYLHRQADILGSDRFHVYVAHLDGHPLSAATVTAFGDRAVFKLAGFADDEQARETRASDLLHWEIMQDAKRLGYRFYDLGGFDREAAVVLSQGGDVPDDLRATASQFKLGFGGSVKVLPEAMWKILPFGMTQRPTAFLIDKVEPLKKRLMSLR